MVGSYAITATAGSLAAANYSFSFVAGTLTVGKAHLTVTADDQSKLYGDANPALSASFSGFVNGDTTGVVTGAPALSTAATAASVVGSYAITATAGSLAAANYSFSFVAGTLTVGKAHLTVTADDQSKLYGDAIPTLTATGTGFKNGDTASVVSGAAGLSTVATAASSVGSYAIMASAGSLTAANYDFLTTNGTLTVTAAPLIVIAGDQSRYYGDANPPLTGLILGIKNSDALSASYMTAADADSSIGSYGITAGVVDGTVDHRLSNYDVTTIDGTLRILKTSLVIVAADKTKVYGSANPLLTGTMVGLKNNDAIAAVYTTAAGDTSAVGTYAIVPAAVDATPGRLSNYDVTVVSGTLTVTTATLTVTADDQSKLYGDANPTLSASFSGFVNGDTASVLSGAPTLTTSATASSAVGTYTITATAGSLAAANYSFSFVAGTLTVGKAHLTVTADDQSKLYGDANPALSASFSGFVNGDTTGVVTGAPALSTAATAASVVGSYAITATAGSLAAANYSFSFVAGTLTVGKAHLTVTADDQSKLYGDAIPTLTATGTGFKNGDTASVVSGAAGLSTVATAASSVGSYAIMASAGSLTAANYDFLTTNGTLTVTAAPLIVIAGDQSRYYGDANPPLTGLILGIKNSDALSASYMTAADADSSIGSYGITAGVVDGTVDHRLSNYDVTTIDGTLRILKTSLVIVAADKTKVYGSANPLLTGTMVGLKNNDAIAAVYTTAAGDTSAVGTYAIVPAAVDATPGRLSNYDVTVVSGTLTVTTATLMVTADDQSKLYGDANPALSALFSGFVNGDTASVLSGAPTLTTSATASSAVGTYTITATAGSLAAANYSFSFVAGTLTVGKAHLTVTADDQSKLYGDAIPTLTATGTGFKNGDTASVVSGAAGLSTVATAASSVGSYAIMASAGSLTAANYDFLTTNGTLTVTAAPLIVIAGDQSRYYGDANPPLTGLILGIKNSDALSASYMTAADADSSIGSYGITAGVVDGTVDHRLSNYDVTTIDGTLRILKTSLVIVAADKTKVYGSADPLLTGTLMGVKNGDSVTVSYGTTATAASHVGPYAITPTLADPDGKLSNYVVSSTDGTLAVTPAPLTIVADSKATVSGAPPPSLTASASGFVNGDTMASLTTPGSLATTAQAGSPPGSYPIIGSGAVDADYAITFVPGTLTVTPSTITNSVVVQGDQVTSLQANASVEMSTTVVKASGGASSQSLATGDTHSPTVVGIHTTKIRTGKRGRAQNGIVVTYSEAVVPAGATALGTYRLASAGRDRRFGTRDDRTMAFLSATYNPATMSVTLTTSGRLKLNQPQKLIVTSSAVVDLAHNALDGNGDGKPGDDYIGLFGPAPRGGAPKRR